MAIEGRERVEAIRARVEKADGEQVCCGQGAQTGEFEIDCCGQPDYMIRIDQADALYLLAEVDRLTKIEQAATKMAHAYAKWATSPADSDDTLERADVSLAFADLGDALLTESSHGPGR